MNVLRVITLSALLTGLGSSNALGNWQCWESGISAGDDFEPGTRLECRTQDTNKGPPPSKVPKLKAEQHNTPEPWSLFLDELLDSFLPS